MAEYLIKDTTLTAIADAVRAKTEKTDSILVSNLADEIDGISTGVELNFDVVGGTTQPSSASENTIWVNTDQEITSWVFSATEPTNPTEGMVWITTNNASTVAFNALKKDGIQVYPMSSVQFVGGAWIDKTAQSYLNGAWTNWIPSGALYWDGVQAVEWIEKPSLNISGWTCKSPTFNDNDVTLAPGAFESIVAGIVTKNKVDISGYSKLVVELESLSVGSGRTFHMQIANSQNTNWESSVIAKNEIGSSATKIELPFTASGSYYIDIYVMRTAVAKIKRIYLE